ncbi:HNH endonuclease [Vibrio vulnificus]|nr:HNH endonuclease [Vibrio vulnificus]
MTIDTLFYTQVGTIVSFIVALFVQYRLLVSVKDATIENLKQQISSQAIKIKDLEEQDPDILLQRYQRRMEALEKQLGELELEGAQSKEKQVENIEKVEKIEQQLATYEESFERGVQITRLRRSVTAKTRARLMKLYDGTCQICGVKEPSIMEICHIKPFSQGGEHLLDNMLLLCSNHHKMFDRGQLGINPDLSLTGVSGELNKAPEHDISKNAIEWHRNNIVQLEEQP